MRAVSKYHIRYSRTKELGAINVNSRKRMTLRNILIFLLIRKREGGREIEDDKTNSAAIKT